MGSNLSKAVKVETLTAAKTYKNFESITVIDAGATDGFNIAGTDGVFGFIPTGIVVNVGGAGIRPCEELSIDAADGKSLNVTVIIYS